MAEKPTSSQTMTRDDETKRTVAAMSTALELCLAALPQRGRPNAMASLSTAVGASRGPRDPERARLYAVEMLIAVCRPEPSHRNI
jgi:hypothetical protein